MENCSDWSYLIDIWKLYTRTRNNLMSTTSDNSMRDIRRNFDANFQKITELPIELDVFRIDNKYMRIFDEQFDAR